MAHLVIISWFWHVKPQVVMCITRDKLNKGTI